MNYTFKNNKLSAKSNKISNSILESDSSLSFQPISISKVLILGYGSEYIKEKVKSMKLSLEKHESISELEFSIGNTSIEINNLQNYDIPISTEFTITLEF